MQTPGPGHGLAFVRTVEPLDTVGDGPVERDQQRGPRQARGGQILRFILPAGACYEGPMPRSVGERFACDKCGAELVYTKPCPCAEAMKHSEVCCGDQMRRVEPSDDSK